jgi:hydroxymethylpyrimidine pyrophosphatase-like HAD family hydrolase
MLTKDQIAEELKMAYAEKEYKEDMLNYVDKDFVDVVAYEIKAIDFKMKALRNMYDKAEETPKEKASKFWSGYILSCMQVPVGVKKDTAVGKHDSI